MSWCPKCKSEYIGKIEKCKDCDVYLVEKLNDKVEKEQVHDKQVLLVNVANEIEAGMVTSLLKSNNIETVQIKKGSGEYLKLYMGVNTLGIDIYVLESDFQDAKQILDTQTNDNIYEEFYENEEDNNEETYNNKILLRRRVIVWIIIIIFSLCVMSPYVVIVILLLYFITRPLLKKYMR